MPQTVTVNVEWSDVQGLVLSGYGNLRFSAFVLWRFLGDGPEGRTAARAWLAAVADQLLSANKTEEAEPTKTEEASPAASTAPKLPYVVTSLGAMKARTRQQQSMGAINLALTARGLRRLGLDASQLDLFSREFIEGMAPSPATPGTTPRRCNLLGDVGCNSPERWHWGGWRGNNEIDGVLLLYADGKSCLDQLIQEQVAGMVGAAEPVPSTLPAVPGPLVLKGVMPEDQKEHFGFRDGISQPLIAGTPMARNAGTKEQRVSVVQPGQFVLGYPNERNDTVALPAPAAGTGAAARDLRRNGTYLVLRQLEQDVPAFRSFVANAAQRVHGVVNGETKEWVASRLIGRRTSGEPLIGPDAGSVQSPEKRNDFLFHFEDRHGLVCPIGAHVRRANPRDTIGPDPDTALRLSKMHRVIRRGRSYGPPLPRDDAAQEKADASEPRGILFVALNADIASQFEMIQHSWMNNVHFGGLYLGTDPLSHFRAGNDVMTIQRRPINLHLDGLAPFVHMRGGAYFFLPGINALRLLAAQPSADLGGCGAAVPARSA